MKVLNIKSLGKNILSLRNLIIFELLQVKLMLLSITERKYYWTANIMKENHKWELQDWNLNNYKTHAEANKITSENWRRLTNKKSFLLNSRIETRLHGWKVIYFFSTQLLSSENFHLTYANINALVKQYYSPNLNFENMKIHLLLH